MVGSIAYAVAAQIAGILPARPRVMEPYALMRALFALIPMLMAAPAFGQTISGPAVAVDGDSLEMTGVRIRLFGIDAPEKSQSCQRGSEAWACGPDARQQLAELISGATVECEQRDVDVYGRIVAICRVGRLDLAEVMAGAGLAIALPDFTDAYVDDAARAKQHRLGLWGSTFEMPAAWRTAHRITEAKTEARPAPARSAATRRPARAAGCGIKGNRSRRGEWIYHVPGMPYYEQTRAEEMFCSEADAVAAGYRRAIVRP